MVEYLELFKGDDTDFSLNQAICIKLVTDYDLAGCTAHVKFYDYEQTFYPIVDKKLPLSFPGSVTSKFPLGRGSAKIWLTEPAPDGAGTRKRTIANDLKIIVTNNIDLLSRKDISYTMLLEYNYNDLDSKPIINGITVEGDKNGHDYGLANLNDIPVVEKEIFQGYFYNDKFYSDREHTIIIEGKPEKIYIDIPTNRQYRWDGNKFAKLSIELDDNVTKNSENGVKSSGIFAWCKSVFAEVGQLIKKFNATKVAVPTGAYTFNDGRNGFKAWVWRDSDFKIHAAVVNKPDNCEGIYIEQGDIGKVFFIYTGYGEALSLRLESESAESYWEYDAPAYEWIDVVSETIPTITTTSPIEVFVNNPDDEVLADSANAISSRGVWSWVKSLLPSWLTPSREEPPTQASVAAKYTKPNTGIPKTDLASGVQTSLDKADAAAPQSTTYTKDGTDAAIVANVENSTTSDSTTKALSANMGKELQAQIQNLKQRGRYLSVWNCATGLAKTTPTVNPYEYKAGDYFIVGTVAAEGGTNYRPSGTQYDKDIPSTTVETGTPIVNDTYYYDGSNWTLLHTQQAAVTWGSIADKPTEFPSEAHTHTNDNWFTTAINAVKIWASEAFAAIVHSHAMSEVTGLAGALGEKRDYKIFDVSGSVLDSITASITSRFSAPLINDEYILNSQQLPKHQSAKIGENAFSFSNENYKIDVLWAAPFEYAISIEWLKVYTRIKDDGSYEHPAIAFWIHEYTGMQQPPPYQSQVYRISDGTAGTIVLNDAESVLNVVRPFKHTYLAFQDDMEKRLPKTDVIDPSSATAPGKAADALAVKGALAGKIDIRNGKAIGGFTITDSEEDDEVRLGINSDDEMVVSMDRGAHIAIFDSAKNGYLAYITDLADLLAKFTPAYSTSTTYAVGAIVSHNGTIYQCISATSGAWDATKWAARNLSSLFSDDNGKGNAWIDGRVVPLAVNAYSASSTYEVGEIVNHNGVAYKCVTAITTAEAWTSAHWTTATSADLAVRLKGLKSDGTVTDQFATDFLGKQVAIQKIDERLPIPISAKNAGFTTESYKRFVVTVGGNMTVTLHTPTAKQGGGYDADVFECRFDGASLAADASIAFAGATATTIDTNCGTVTAGKVALMSAFWNGTTWDVNWKVEG